MPKTAISETVDMFGPRYSIEHVNGVVAGGPNYDNPRISRRTRARATVNTPGYRSLRVRKAGLPHNSFSYTEQSFQYPYGVTYQEYNLNPSTVYRLTIVGILVGGIDFSDESPITDAQKTSVVNQAANKALLDLKGMKVNLGVAFGERKRTSDLILGTAKRLSTAYKSLRSGNIGGVSDALGITKRTVDTTLRSAKRRSRTSNTSKALANEWLALQYGWKPLLSDVYGAAEQLASLSDERRVKFVASKSARGFNSSVVQWYSVPCRRVAQGIYTRKYTFVYHHSSEVLKNLSSFGVTNPAAVAWELLPWSFVFDWFIPLGNYIDTWDATLGLVFEKGSLTTFDKYTVQFKADGMTRSGGTTYYAHGGAKITKVSCTRVPLSAFPSPTVPGFQAHITQNRGISFLALLRQQLKL